MSFLLEDNVSRELGPFRFVELLKALADAAPHVYRFQEVTWPNGGSDWWFQGGGGLWETVFRSECTPTRIDKAWGYFGPVASRLQCFPAFQPGRSYLEQVIEAMIAYYTHGTKP